MIPVTTFSQRDPKWANKYVGFSKLPFKSVGCTVTALASLVSYVYQETYTPSRVNDLLKNVNGFVGAYVLWSKIPVAFSKLRFIKRVYAYNNLETSLYVYGRRMPVLVEVNASRIGAVRHWVLFLGSQKEMDAWDGAIKSTSTYPPTGEAFIQKA